MKPKAARKPKPSAAAPGIRHMRFELPEQAHTEARILRAQTGHENDALFQDMMRVYKKHPKEWSKAAVK